MSIPPIAQLVEQLPFKERVPGSNPGGRTKMAFLLSLILHNVRSAENVGSILRTADAVGVERVYLCGITPAPVDRFGRPNVRVLKASLGAEESVFWEQREDIFVLLHELKKSGVHTLALEQSPRAVDYKKVELTKPSVLIMGSEVEGVGEELLLLCDEVIEIPMRGTKESLNVAVATGIALYALID